MMVGSLHFQLLLLLFDICVCTYWHVLMCAYCMLLVFHSPIYLALPFPK